MLGKRKRDHAAVPRQSVEAEEVTKTSNALDLFKQYFEAKFEPLLQEPGLQQASSADEDGFEEEDQSEISDWSGFTENDTRVDEVQVIEHTVVSGATAEPGASEGKYFMVRSGMYIGSLMAYLQTQSSKPPLVGKTISARKVTTGPAEAKEDPTDAANLKKDLDLQRLLKESHLLDRPTLSATPTANRERITDLRMQALGAKASLFGQQKMPLSHRRGIKAKATAREEVRRKEAQENGVILERASKGKRSDIGKRDRGVGTPAVGKFAGATLKLSRKDIHEINGPREAIRGKRKGKR